MYKKAISVIAALALVTVLILPVANASHSTEVTIDPIYTVENRREIFDITVKNRGPDPIENVGIEVLPTVLTQLIAGENAFVALRDVAEAYDEIAVLLESIGKELEVAENELEAYGYVIFDNVYPLLDAVGTRLASIYPGVDNVGVLFTDFAYYLKKAGQGMYATPVDFVEIGDNVDLAWPKLENAGIILAGEADSDLQAAGENLREAAAILDNVADNLRAGSLLTPSLDLADVADRLISAGTAFKNYTGSGQATFEAAGEDLIDAANLLAPPYDVETELEVIIRGKDTAYNTDQAKDPPWIWYDNYPPVLAAAKVDNGAIVVGGTMPTCRDGRWNEDELDVFLDIAFQWMVSGADSVLWYEGYEVYNTTEQCSDLVAALEDLDYSVTGDSTEPIADINLSSYDILVIPQMQLGGGGTGDGPGDPSLLPGSDVLAIVDFVKAGGGLLIMEGTDFGGHNFYIVQNKILEAFGASLVFQDDSVYDDTNNQYANFAPWCDVDDNTDIGSAYEAETDTDNIGMYSICSLAEPLPRAKELYKAGYAISSAGGYLETITGLLSKVGSDIENYVLPGAGALILDAVENLDIVDNILSTGTAVVRDNLAAASEDLGAAARILREKLGGGSGIRSAADNLAEAAELMGDNVAKLADAGDYFIGASSGFSDASDDVGATATAIEPPLGWEWNSAENMFFAMEIEYPGMTIVSGKVTARTVDQTGETPRRYYGVGDRPPIIAAAEVGDGAVVAAGVAGACRDGRWQEGEWEVFLDNAFQWMVPGAEDVLWYEGYNVYNNTTRCSDLIDNLEALGYSVVDDSTEPITSGLLAPYDILVIPQLEIPPENLPSADVDNIVAFVEGGGGLLIMEQSDYLGNHYSKVHNKILKGLGVGIRFQDDQVEDVTNNWRTEAYPTCDVDTTTDIGSAYKDATGEDEIGMYSACSLIVIDEDIDPMIAESENVMFSLLALVQPGIEMPRIRVRTYDVPYGDNFLWNDLVPDLAVNAEQEGTPLGLVGSVNDGGKVTVEVAASEPLSELGEVYVCDSKDPDDNLLPALDMNPVPGTDDEIWTGDFTVENDWDDQTIYVLVAPGSKDLHGWEVTEVKSSDPIQVVNSAPIITDNGFADALAMYTLELEVDNNVLYATEDPIWDLSGLIGHVPEYFDSLRFDENWWVTVYINGVEVENVKTGSENFIFRENEVDLGADGPKTLTLRVVDAAGNTAENIQENIFLDNTDPTIDFVEIAGRSFRSGIPVNDNTPILSLELADSGYPGTGLGLVENECYIWWTLLDEDNNLIELENKSPLDNTRKGTIDLDLGLPENPGELEEGEYILHVWAFDELNTGYENFEFVIDVTPPAMPSAPTVTIPELTRVPRATIAGTAEPNSTITVYILDETLTVVDTAEGIADSTGSFVIIVDLPEGTSRLEVSATDEAGNESSRRYYGTVTVDSVVPTVTITSPAPDSSTSGQSIAIVGKVSEPATWTLMSPVGTWTGSTDADGNFSVSVSLVEGANTIIITAEDDAGNISSPKSITVTRTVTAWGTYAIILVIVALVLAAIAIFRKK